MVLCLQVVLVSMVHVSTGGTSIYGAVSTGGTSVYGECVYRRY